MVLLRSAGLAAYLLGLFLGIAALALVVSIPGASQGGLAGGLLAAAFLGLAGVLDLVGNVLYVVGLALRPLSYKLLGPVTIVWGSGHLAVGLSGLPLKGVYALVVPKALIVAGLAYIVVGLAMTLRGLKLL